MLSNNNVREKLFPISLLFFIDALLTALSFILSYALCSYIVEDINAHSMLIQLPIVVSLTSLIFLFIGIYKGFVKTNGLQEVYSIFNAICLANILTIVLVVVNGKLILEDDLMVPLSIIIVHSILSFSALVLSRILYKNLVNNLVKRNAEFINVLFVHDINDKDDKLFALEQFFLDKGRQVSIMLNSNIFNFERELLKIISDNPNIQEIHILENPRNGQIDLNRLEVILSQDIPIYKVDSDLFNKDSYSNGFEATTYLNRLSLDNLFPEQIKDSITLDHTLKTYYGETILVTGAGGSVGSEFAKELFNTRVKATLILLDHSETALSKIATFMGNSNELRIVPKLVDLKDKNAVERIFENYNVSSVVHAAGNNFPESLNENISKVMQDNLTTTKILADISKANGVRKFIFCSTVGASYPRTTLEVSKRLAEIYIESLNTDKNLCRFIALRLNRVYQSSGSGIGYIKNQIDYEKPINRCFFSEYEVYTNNKDVAKALMFVADEDTDLSTGILTLKVGTVIKTELIAKVIKNLNLSGKTITRKSSINYKNDFKNNAVCPSKERFSKNNLDVQDLFIREKLEEHSYSKSQIQQKIENLCINLLFDQDDISLIFDLIQDFNSDQWENLFKFQQQKSVQRKVIRLQSK